MRFENSASNILPLVLRSYDCAAILKHREDVLNSYRQELLTEPRSVSGRSLRTDLNSSIPEGLSYVARK
jgi:hypothetical protein